MTETGTRNVHLYAAVGPELTHLASRGVIAGVVSGLAITPVKGTRLRAVDSIRLDEDGVRENRRFFLIDASYSARQQQIVKLLLANGADPSSAAPNEEGDGRGRLSALYGCCRQPGNPAVPQSRIAISKWQI